jgi:hypothetical protein
MELVDNRDEHVPAIKDSALFAEYARSFLHQRPAYWTGDETFSFFGFQAFKFPVIILPITVPKPNSKSALWRWATG